MGWGGGYKNLTLSAILGQELYEEKMNVHTSCFTGKQIFYRAEITNIDPQNWGMFSIALMKLIMSKES